MIYDHKKRCWLSYNPRKRAAGYIGLALAVIVALTILYNAYAVSISVHVVRKHPKEAAEVVHGR